MWLIIDETINAALCDFLSGDHLVARLAKSEARHWLSLVVAIKNERFFQRMEMIYVVASFSLMNKT